MIEADSVGSGHNAYCPGHFQPLYSDVEFCPTCGLGRTAGPMPSVDVQDYLAPDEIGGALRPDYFRELYATYVAGGKSGRALDVGCGRGEWVRLLDDHRWIAHGIDAYKGFEPDGIRFFRASLAEFKPTEPYDLITLVHCFEHIGQPLESLDKLAALLTPGGRLLIIVPNFGGVWSAICGDHWHMLKTAHHAYHYTPESLRRMLKHAGFSITDMRTYSGYAPSPWEMRLLEAHFYESGIGAINPIRAVMQRANSMIRPFLNFGVDRRLAGAEIQVVAQVSEIGSRAASRSQ